jgi:hypothetical protein
VPVGFAASDDRKMSAASPPEVWVCRLFHFHMCKKFNPNRLEIDQSVLRYRQHDRKIVRCARA